MSRYIESIQIKDGIIHNLEYHQKRVDDTFASIYPQLTPLQLKSLIKKEEIPVAGKYKWRVVYDDQKVDWEMTAYSTPKIKSLRKVAIDFLYPFKSENRNQLNDAYWRKHTQDDVLMIRDGMVTDTWFCNVAFLKNGIWYTPKNPLIDGTMRAKLLEDAKIEMAEIKETDISSFEKITLFNAMNEIGEIEFSINSIF